MSERWTLLHLQHYPQTHYSTVERGCWSGKTGKVTKKQKTPAVNFSIPQYKKAIKQNLFLLIIQRSVWGRRRERVDLRANSELWNEMLFCIAQQPICQPSTLFRTFFCYFFPFDFFHVALRTLISTWVYTRLKIEGFFSFSGFSFLVSAEMQMEWAQSIKVKLEKRCRRTTKDTLYSRCVL